jgi:large subunit ribosomal protein L25
MAATRPVFKVTDRTEFGSRTTRRLRREGLVPGVVYTGGEAARPFQADAHELSLFINEGHALFDLEIEGAGKVPVVVKEEQRHPVRGDLMHLDCQQVDLAQEIQADIAIELTGVEDAPGVKEGGILEHVTRDITIEALPEAIPDEGISVDVSAMIIGDTIQLDTVEAPEGVKFVAENPEEVTIATLNPPKVVEEEPEVEEETEVIGEGDADAEGDSEGASGDSGDSGDEGDSGSEG